MFGRAKSKPSQMTSVLLRILRRRSTIYDHGGSHMIIMDLTDFRFHDNLERRTFRTNTYPLNHDSKSLWHDEGWRIMMFLEDAFSTNALGPFLVSSLNKLLTAMCSFGHGRSSRPSLISAKVMNQTLCFH